MLYCKVRPQIGKAFQSCWWNVHCSHKLAQQQHKWRLPAIIKFSTECFVCRYQPRSSLTYIIMYYTYCDLFNICLLLIIWSFRVHSFAPDRAHYCSMQVAIHVYAALLVLEPGTARVIAKSATKTLNQWSPQPRCNKSLRQLIGCKLCHDSPLGGGVGQHRGKRGDSLMDGMGCACMCSMPLFKETGVWD